MNALTQCSGFREAASPTPLAPGCDGTPEVPASPAASADANNSGGQGALSAETGGSEVVASQNGGLHASPYFCSLQQRNHVWDVHQKLRKMVRQERLSIRRASLQCQLRKAYRESEVLHHRREPFACFSAARGFPAIPPATELKREDAEILDSSRISRHDQQVSIACGQEFICTMRKKKECSIEWRSTRGGCSSNGAAGEVRRASHRTPIMRISRFRHKASRSVTPPVSRHSRQEADRAAGASRKLGFAGAAIAECITVFDSSSDSCSSDCQPLSFVVKKEEASREASVASGTKKRQHTKGSLLRRNREDVPRERAQTNKYLTFRGSSARRSTQERDQRQQVASRVTSSPAHGSALQRNQRAAEPRAPTQVRGPDATQGGRVEISQEASSLPSTSSQDSTLEGAGEGAQQQRRRPQLSMSQEQVSSGTSTHGTLQQQWPECVYDMLGPEIFSRVKEQPELILAVSRGSGMTMFHHMLRHQSRDDEQMLELFKCIYEDAALRERVSLPCLTDLKCNRGQTLAFYAAAYGHVNCLNWILQQAGGVKEQIQYLAIRDDVGDTPLHHAARGGHQKLIELLLDKDPNMINKARWDGQTPIFDAFECPRIVRLLLRYGADCHVRSAKGRTPLEEAKREYRWKRECDSRPTAVLPKRVRATVQVLRRAETDVTRSYKENSEPQQQIYRGMINMLSATELLEERLGLASSADDTAILVPPTALSSSSTLTFAESKECS
ncbi:hypothetical protein Esti_001907 [Eimeria stiedai]